jgi:hypothetical protein
MPKRGVAALAPFLGLVLLVGSAASAEVQVGQVAPDFTLTDLQGVSHTLSTYRGQVVLLALVGYG